MLSGRGRALIAATAGVAAASLGAAAGASPPGPARAVTESSGFKYVTVERTAPAGVFAELTAPCPGSSHVWGGGETNTAGYDGFELRQSHPSDDSDGDQKPDDGWTVGVKATAEQQVTVSAVCARPLPRYVVLEEEIFPGNKAFFKVKCPRGTNVSGGGIQGPELMAASSSFPPTEISWGVEVENYTPVGNETPFTAYAVCPSRDLTNAAQDVMVRVRSTQLPPGEETGKTVSCRNGRVAVGGGLSTAANIFETIGNDSGLRGHLRFRASADNSAGAEREFSAFALCSVPL